VAKVIFLSYLCLGMCYNFIQLFQDRQILYQKTILAIFEMSQGVADIYEHVRILLKRGG
jgi:hypothetical protein